MSSGGSKKSVVNQVGHAFGDAANAVGSVFGLGPSSNGVSLNDIIQEGQNNALNQGKKLQPPNVSDAQNSSLFGELSNLAKMRQRRTLFTGGSGLSDSATTASATLLGV